MVVFTSLPLDLHHVAPMLTQVRQLVKERCPEPISLQLLHTAIMLAQAITEAFGCIRSFTSLCHHCDHVSRADCVIKRCVLLILLLSAAVTHSSEEGCRFSAADQK